MQEVNLLLESILNNLSENKADKIVNIDLNGKSEQLDNMVIASGTSNRHVVSISEKLISLAKRDFGVAVRTEGIRNADWVLIDFGDVIVHIFRQEVRDFYQLERIWQHNSHTHLDIENI